MVEMIKPAGLKPGDTIGVVAPASWPNQENARKAVRFFEELGLHVHFGEALSRQYGYLAGTDEERAHELHQMFLHPEIKGIFCVCGGYGTGRIASSLDYEVIRANPKVFWGYSDITFLLNAIYQRTGLVTFHGAMLSSDIGTDDVHPVTLKTFEQLMTPQIITISEEFSPLQTIVEGEASGPLVGGNLSLLVSTLGTAFEIDTKDKILFIEDIDEEPYRVDRMLNQLKMAGKFDEAAGIMICDFNNCVPGKRKQSLTLEQLFIEHIQPSGKPTLQGFKIGHCSPNLAVPIGVVGRINTNTKSLTIEEPGITDENGGKHEYTKY